MPVAEWSRREHFLYLGMSLACIITVFVGFSRTFYLGSVFQADSLSPLFVLHGLVFSGWILLFFVQSALVATHRVRVHRRLGFIGVSLAFAMVILGLATAIASAQNGFPVRGDRALASLARFFGDMVVFAAFVTTAIGYRRRPDLHKRFMLLATISILNPAIARWPLDITPAGPIAVYAIQDLFIVAAVVYELAFRHRVHPAYLFGGFFMVTAQAARLILGRSDAWLSFARVLVQAPMLGE